MTKLTVETVKPLVEQGLSTAAIASQLGVNERWVRKFRANHGLSAGGLKPLTIDAVQPLIRQGLSSAEIATRLGVCKSSVNRFCRRLGIQTPRRKPTPIDVPERIPTPKPIAAAAAPKPTKSSVNGVMTVAAVKELIERRWSSKRIGKELGASSKAVCNFCKRHGLQLNPIRGNPKGSIQEKPGHGAVSSVRSLNAATPRQRDYYRQALECERHLFEPFIVESCK